VGFWAISDGFMIVTEEDTVHREFMPRCVPRGKLSAVGGLSA
jgi:hypothetical protein